MSKSSVDLERLTAAVERVESGGNPNAVSPKGAEGPMQVMPKTGKKPGYGIAPARDKSPEENRRVGREYLSAMVNKYGDIDTALVAYNWGPGNTDKWLKKGANPEKLPTETQNYVPRVKSLLGETPVQPQAQPTDRAALDNQKFIEARAAARNTRRAASPVAPVAEGPLKGLSEAHAKGVEKIGPNYQAALALSMGAGSRTAEQEPMLEEMPEEAAPPSRAAIALAQLKDMPVASAFGAQRAMAGGGLAENDNYAPIDLSPQSYDSVEPAPLLSIRNTPQSSSRSELSQMPIPGGMLQKQETVTAKKGKKGSAKGDLAELEYKLALQSAAVKDQMQGLGSSTSAFGSPAFTHRGAMSKPMMGVAHLEKGGTASQMLEVLKGYGKKAQEFAVENMISPADIATLAMKAKRMVPAGMLTYSGGLNEGEDAEIARMRENDRPNPPPKHFAWGGTAAFGDYYNPTTKTYTDAPPMMANPDYTTATYYEQDPSGKYVASKDPYKAAGPVYSYTPAVAGTDPYGDDEGWNPGTPGTPESYNAVAKPAATWNQAKILDPKSGYVSTTGGTPVATGDRQSNWKGSAPSTPASVLVPTRQPGITPPAGVTPGTSPTPDPVPTRQPGINAPVVRNNPYAMPAAPAKPNPWEPGGEVHIPEEELRGLGSNPDGIAAPVVRDNPYTMPKNTPVQAMLPKRPPPSSQPPPKPVVDTGLVPPPPQPTPWIVNRAEGSPPTGERSYEKTARDDYENFRNNAIDEPSRTSEFDIRSEPRPSKALAKDMEGTNIQKVPPRTYFYNDADLTAGGWTQAKGKNKGAIVVAGREDNPKKIRDKINTIGHELHHRRVMEVGEDNMPLHPTWPFGGISPENSEYNWPRQKTQEVMHQFMPERVKKDYPTDISTNYWGNRASRNAQEQIANLAGYEAMQKTGTPISQTAVGKAMLEKDPALLDYFYSQTSAGRPGGGVWDMHSAEYKRAITPSMKEKAAEMFKKWLVSRGINTVNR